jgi:hypothetical protein
MILHRSSKPNGCQRRTVLSSSSNNDTEYNGCHFMRPLSFRLRIAVLYFWALGAEASFKTQTLPQGAGSLEIVHFNERSIVTSQNGKVMVMKKS